MRSSLSVAFLVAALVLAVTHAWERWGPVPQAPVAASDGVAQWDARTCGPAAVATLLNVYGKPWSKAGLARECRVGAKGSAMYDLLETLRRHRVPAEAWRATAPSGLERTPRPFIAHLTEGHYVVAVSYAAGTFEIFDPTFGRRYRRASEDLYMRSGGWVLAAD